MISLGAPVCRSVRFSNLTWPLFLSVSSRSVLGEVSKVIQRLLYFSTWCEKLHLMRLNAHKYLLRKLDYKGVKYVEKPKTILKFALKSYTSFSANSIFCSGAFMYFLNSYAQDCTYCYLCFLLSFYSNQYISVEQTFYDDTCNVESVM